MRQILPMLPLSESLKWIIKADAPVVLGNEELFKFLSIKFVQKQSPLSDDSYSLWHLKV